MNEQSHPLTRQSNEGFCTYESCGAERPHYHVEDADGEHIVWMKSCEICGRLLDDSERWRYGLDGNTAHDACIAAIEGDDGA